MGIKKSIIGALLVFIMYNLNSSSGIYCVYFKKSTLYTYDSKSSLGTCEMAPGSASVDARKWPTCNQPICPAANGARNAINTTRCPGWGHNESPFVI